MGEEHVKNHDLSSLRILGTVGEPINPEAWHWYNDYAGKNECAIVDTYWMTETGSHVIAPIPGAIPTKPGSATFPFFGYELEIIDPTSGKVLEGNDVEGVLVCKKPWPSIARTVYRDHKRYLETYMKPYPGYFFFGDGAARDSDGYLWIKGRVDGTFPFVLAIIDALKLIGRRNQRIWPPTFHCRSRISPYSPQGSCRNCRRWMRRRCHWSSSTCLCLHEARIR
jgi:acyl-coenzyme A synthetase/AMP-(fatty) acid ligase